MRQVSACPGAQPPGRNERPLRWRQYGSQIVFLHLRDQHQDGRWSEALGEGDMDYPAIATALREIHFQGDVIIELAHEQRFKSTRPLRESLKISRQFVQHALVF